MKLGKINHSRTPASDLELVAWAHALVNGEARCYTMDSKGEPVYAPTSQTTFSRGLAQSDRLTGERRNA